MSERMFFLQLLLDEYDSTKKREMCFYHKVECIPVHDPVTSRMAIMVVQKDVTESVEMENKIRNAANRQLQVMDRLFPSHIIQYMLRDKRLSENSATEDFGSSTACDHAAAVVMFMDLSGFTAMSQSLQARDVLDTLNSLYKECDDVCKEYGMFNLDIVADCYICVGALLQREKNGFYSLVDKRLNEDEQFVRCEALRLFYMARDMLYRAYDIFKENPLMLRVGLHCGPVASGVIGVRSPKFTLLGDTMNTASRMESTGIPGWIQVSKEYADLLEGLVHWDETRLVHAKGKGNLQTFLFKVLA